MRVVGRTLVVVAAVGAMSGGVAGADVVVNPPGPCVDKVLLDPAGDAPVDVEVVGVSLDCTTGTWSVDVGGLSSPLVGEVQGIEVALDADDNPRNGCEGAEWLVRYADGVGGAYAVASCATAPTRTGDVQGTLRDSVRSISWPASAIDDPRLTIGVRVVVTGAGGSLDSIPDDGMVEVPGPDGYSVPRLPRPVVPSMTTSNGRCEIPLDPGLIRDSVIRLYYAYFHRDALDDPAGLDYWQQQYGSGALCLTEVSEYFARSAEFVGTYGDLTDPEFVRRVYLNVLGREPDPDGYTYWSTQLAIGAVRRGAMMVGFSESPEFRSISGVP